MTFHSAQSWGEADVKALSANSVDGEGGLQGSGDGSIAGMSTRGMSAKGAAE